MPLNPFRLRSPRSPDAAPPPAPPLLSGTTPPAPPPAPGTVQPTTPPPQQMRRPNFVENRARDVQLLGQRFVSAKRMQAEMVLKREGEERFARLQHHTAEFTRQKLLESKQQELANIRARIEESRRIDAINMETERVEKEIERAHAMERKLREARARKGRSEEGF